MTYYFIRISAALFFMVSLGAGLFTYTEYGTLAGLIIFLLFATVGVILHIYAEKTAKKYRA